MNLQERIAFGEKQKIEVDEWKLEQRERREVEMKNLRIEKAKKMEEKMIHEYLKKFGIDEEIWTTLEEMENGPEEA